MEIREDFAERVEGLCTTIPRPAIANLLAALMPRQPVKVRPPTPAADFRQEPDGRVVENTPPDPLTKLTKKRRNVKRRSVDRTYTVFNLSAERNHRMGSWRRAMVECAVAASSEREALNTLAVRYPEFIDKGIDFAWCQQVGYISNFL